MKIKKNSIVIVIMCLLIINIPYLSQSVNNLLSLGMEIVLMLFLFSYTGIVASIKRCLPIATFLLFMLISTSLNFGLSTRLINAFTTGLGYMLITLTIIVLNRVVSYQSIINKIWKFFCTIIIVMDLSVLFTLGKGIGNDGGVLPYYLLGNKFSVSYYHMFFICIFIIQNNYMKNIRKRRKFVYVLLIYSLFICKMVDCTTGIIGCLVIGIIFIVGFRRNVLIEFISRSNIYIINFVGSSFLLIGTDVLLNNKYVQSIIMVFFHRSLTLTGRLKMYEITMQAIIQKPLFGHGINCTYVEQVLSWGNAQNGLLKMLLDFGIIGTIVFLFYCWIVFLKPSNQKYMPEISYPMVAFLYGMAFCSMVEINLSGLFFLGLALMYILKRENKNNTFEI